MISVMKTIYLDDKQVELAGKNLGTVLGSAREQLANTSRIVVEVQINGETLEAEQINEKQSEEFEEAELRLYTADPNELAILTLEQVREGLTDVKTVQEQAAEMFQRDEQMEAMKQISTAINIWQQTQQAMLSTVRLLKIDIDDRVVEGQSVHEMAELLIEQLGTLRELLTAMDTVGLADVLAFEWPETVQRWDRFISEMIGWIKKEGAQ